MASLSQALRLEDLPSSHSAFQGHAAHIIEWPMMLRPKDSEGTCIPSGVITFLQAASRRSPRSDYYAPSDFPLCHRAFVGRLRLPTFPLPLPSIGASPVFTAEDSNKRGLGGVFLIAPSALCGSPVAVQGKQVSLHHLLPLSAGKQHRSLLLLSWCSFRWDWLTY